MKNIVKGLLCLTACAVITGCNRLPSWNTGAFEADGQINTLSADAVIENSRFSLSWDDTTKRVLLNDKQKNVQWSTTPVDAMDMGVDEFGFPLENHPNVESALIVEYIDPKTHAIMTVNTKNSVLQDGRISCEAIENGIAVTYFFDQEQISVTAEYTLRETGVGISIDPAKIRENKNKVYRISVAPFFCGIGNKAQDAYLFVPSGSGALIYPKEVSRSGSTFSEQVYGFDASIDVRDKPTTGKNILMPVYGAKSGNKAVCAIIESSASSAYIESVSGSSALGYTSVYATFLLRGYADVQAKIFSGIKRSNLYSDSMIKSKITVGFYPLYDEDASYSGMAKVYRKYLSETSDMPASTDKETGLHLRFLGGAMIKKSFLGIPYETLNVTASINDAKSIIEDIHSQTGVTPSVELEGFGQSGTDVQKLAGNYQIGSGLGSVKDLKEIQDYCNGLNINLFFNLDFIRFGKSGAGWSFVSDVARGVNNQAVYQYRYHMALRSRNSAFGSFAYLSRNQIKDSGEKLLKKTNSWDLSGIGVGSIANTAYSDISDIAYFSKGSIEADVQQVLKDISKSGKKILGSSANAYAAVLADTVTDTPLSSTGHDSFDADIPFYQIVFKGSVALSSEPLNTASNAAALMLSAVESGISVNYTVINAYDVSLIGSSVSAFSQSVYKDIKSKISNNALELKKFYSAVKGAKIANHKILDNGVRVTTFDNGVTVYVNKSAQAQMTDAGEMKAESFVMQEARS